MFGPYNPCLNYLDEKKLNCLGRHFFRSKQHWFEDHIPGSQETWLICFFGWIHRYLWQEPCNWTQANLAHLVLNESFFGNAHAALFVCGCPAFVNISLALINLVHCQGYVVHASNALRTRQDFLSGSACLSLTLYHQSLYILHPSNVQEVIACSP